MIIIHKNQKNMVEFQTLACGDVFRDSNSNTCMKIGETIDGRNMVYLCDGGLDIIDDDEMVEKIRCELVVED